MAERVIFNFRSEAATPFLLNLLLPDTRLCFVYANSLAILITGGAMDKAIFSTFFPGAIR